MTAEEKQTSRGLSVADQLISIMKKWCNFYHTPTGKMFVDIRTNGHKETLPIGEKGGVRHWLELEYYDTKETSPNATAVTQAINWAKAQATKNEHPVYTRIAPDDHGGLYIDLGDATHRVIHITADGWQIIDLCPISFRRPRGMMALPEPAQQGDISRLRPYVNVASDDDFLLLVSWIIGAYHPRGPYPILCLYGPPGSAKTTVTKILRLLIDPHSVAVTAFPEKPADIAIQAYGSYLSAYENISYISKGFSDALCRLSTGAADTKRELYADDELSMRDTRAPCIINSIGDVATEGDLVDRTIAVTLARINEDERQYEDEMYARFSEDTPIIFGGILDALVCAVANLEHTRPKNPPRMADFARWVIAAESTLPWQKGLFLPTYHEHKTQDAETTISVEPIAERFLAYAAMQERENALPYTINSITFYSVFKDWVLKNEELTDEDKKELRKQFPKDGTRLTKKLRTLLGALQKRGYTFRTRHTEKGSVIEIDRFTPTVKKSDPDATDATSTTHVDEDVPQNDHTPDATDATKIPSVRDSVRHLDQSTTELKQTPDATDATSPPLVLEEKKKNTRVFNTRKHLENSSVRSVTASELPPMQSQMPDTTKTSSVSPFTVASALCVVCGQPATHFRKHAVLSGYLCAEHAAIFQNDTASVIVPLEEVQS